MQHNAQEWHSGLACCNQNELQKSVNTLEDLSQFDPAKTLITVTN